MSDPLVSIVIPVYNGANFMREAIDSALHQTYANLEVIVVNDGSRDHGATEAIARSYGNRVRYLYKENGGVATALNMAIQHMNGDYFSWLSHDDLYKPNKVERQIRAAQAHGESRAIIYSDYEWLNEHNGKSSPCHLSSIYTVEQLTNSVFPVLRNVLNGCSLMIHRNHFDRVGMFNEQLRTTQDYDLWFRMLRNQRTIYVPEILVTSREHDDQGSRTIHDHDQERCELHLGFMNALTEDEMTSMFGSPYNYYYQVGSLFQDGPMDLVSQEALVRFRESGTPDRLTEQLHKLHHFIHAISNDLADQICIFGTGVYGKRLYRDLFSKMIAVSSFSDNNSSKWGFDVEQVPCISPAELNGRKERTLVIVANRDPAEIVHQLHLAGYPYVCTKQQLDRMLFSVPPVRWATYHGQVAK